MKIGDAITTAAIVGGIGFLAWKGTSAVSMAREITIKPSFDGWPTVRSGNVYFPIALNVSNPSNGSVHLKVNSGSAYIGQDELATVEIARENAEGYDIAAKGDTVVSGIKIVATIKDLLTVFSTNLAEILSGKFDELKSKLSFRLRVTVAHVLTIDVAHSFAADTILTQAAEGVRGLGLTASGKRTLKPFADYAHLIPSHSNLDKTDEIIISGGSNEDTINLMLQIARKTKDDTARLAQSLKGQDLHATIQNVFDFVHDHIQYVEDSSLREQVRRPLRTLWDRKGDCDCFSTLIGSIFANLGIPFAYRMAALYNRDYYQHVYVIVPTDGGYYVCDPVLDNCFEECAATKFKDFKFKA